MIISNLLLNLTNPFFKVSIENYVFRNLKITIFLSKSQLWDYDTIYHISKGTKGNFALVCKT